jgi:ribonuclease E
MSAFGIIEMTRQRIRPSLKRSVFQECPACNGTGHVKTWESMSIEVMRMLQLAAHRDHVTQIQVRVHPEVSLYLLNRKRKELSELEEKANVTISIAGVPAQSPEFLEFHCYDNTGNEIQFASPEPAVRPRRRYGEIGR